MLFILLLQTARGHNLVSQIQIEAGWMEDETTTNFLSLFPHYRITYLQHNKPWAAVRTMLTETRQTLTNIIGLSSWFCRTFLVHREGFIFLYSAVARKHLWGRGSNNCVCDTARIWEEEVQKLAPLVVQPVLYLQICLVLCNISDIILICSFL